MSWGVFKGVYKGQGLYWHGQSNTYNVEGYGYFLTIALARIYVDEWAAKRKEAELDEAKAKILAGTAIRCEHVNGDAVRVWLPEGIVDLPIRAYRQNVFDWEDKYGKELVFTNERS